MSKLINQFLSFTLSSAFAGFVLITVLLDHQNTSDYNRSNHANKIGRSRSIGKTPLSINRKITSGTNLSRPFIHYAGPITVTNATFPVAGDTLKMAIDNASNPGNAALTPPGANQTWDLSGLQVEATQNSVFATASTGSVNAQVPGAELVTNPTPGTETYYNVTSTAFELQAYYGIAPFEINSNNLFEYSPPLPERHAPLIFFDINSNTSNISKPFLLSSLAPSIITDLPVNIDSVRYRVSIQRLSVVDAWGSLSIPGGTYDVLREKRTEYRTKSIDGHTMLGWLDISSALGNANLHGIGTDTMTSYYFFNDIVKEPIAIVTLDNTQSVSTQVQFKYNAAQASCALTGAFSGNPSGCNDNGTPANPSDDYFTQDVSFNFTSNPMTGDLQLAPGGDQIGSYSIPVSSIVGNSHTFTGVKFKADGTPSLAIGNFTNELTCIDSVFGPAVNACLSGMLCGKITDTMETLRATIVNQTDSDAVNKWYTFCAPSRADALFYADACPINSSLTGNPRSTQFLTLTGFNFSIPNGAEIKGITLSISRRDSSNQDLSTRDSVIMLVNSATGTPDDKKSPLGWSIVPSNTYTIVTYGGPNDLWNAGGATWTPSAINSPNFGVNIQITGTTNSLVASIDEVSITVRYTTFAPDNTPPVLTCPVGTIVTCSTLIPTADASQVIRDDDLATIYFYKDSIPLSDSSCINQKVIYRIYRGVDTCTNLSQCIQMITVRDTMAPTIMCPQDTVEVSCGSGFPAAYTSVDSFVNHGGSVADACCIDSARFSYADDTIINGGMLILNRTYKITDCCGLSDSCTQVFRMPPCLDLALKKEIDGPVPFGVSAGGLIPFKITVYNQRFIPADSIKVIDHLPTIGSTVVTADWINNNNGTACITLSRSNGSLPSTGLLQGDSVVLHFNVQLGPDVSQAIGSNTAEIYSAQDTALNHLGDIDSYPNSFPNDPGEDDVSTAQFLFCDNLSCIDHVNGSLDDHCEKCFVAADFLKGILLPEEYYTIELYDASGKKLAGNCVDRSWLGYTLTYKVISKAPCQVNTCWGTVTIEDKYPPQVGDTIEYKTCFEFAQLPKGPSYKVADNCSDSAVVNIVSENFVDYGCDSALYQGLVTRHLIATDAWGNQTDFTKKIYILKLSLDSIVCARDTAIDCSLEVVNGVRITDPKRSGAPLVKIGGKLVSLWPNNQSCKLEVLYKDERQDVCGTSYKILRYWTITDWCSNPVGRDTVCRQIIEVKDTTRPVVYDTILPVYYSSPHDCGQFIDLPALRYGDCNTVTETYLLKYYEEGKLRILSGKLPASHIWLPTGTNTVEVNVTDACNNIGKGKITIHIVDNTPPTPICDEFTQVTVDPASCWSSVAAADLDNGSLDNCCSLLHFAAAKMDSIVYWRNYWTNILEEKCGKTEFWNNKSIYDTWIEDWIDCYVFADTVHFDECGTNQVVLRVYEACNIPRRDVHIFPWSEHAWYCYHTNDVYRIAHNFNFFDTKGAKSKSWRLPLDCKSILEKWLSDQRNKYISTRYGYNIATNDITNLSMDSIQSHSTYCPGDTSINLNPGECSRIIKYSFLLPVGYTTVQTSGLPPGSEFPIGTTTNSFQIKNGNTLVTTCSFSVTIKEFELFPSPILPMDTIKSHGTYCPGDTSINLNPGECSRIVKYSFLLPVGYTTVQTSGLPPGSEFPIGTTTNTFQIKNGNTLVTTCNFTVTIKEFAMPSSDVFCKENTTIILQNGSAILGAGQVLINALYGCYDNYIVELVKNGNFVPGVVGFQDLGKNYTYRVTDPKTGNRCTGQVLVSTPPLYCTKEQITIKLNNSGFAFVGAGKVLIDAQYRCFDNYIVEFFNGNYRPAVAGFNDLGDTLTFRVTDPVSSATCTGKVFIDDVNNSIEQLNYLNDRRKSRVLYNDCMVNVLVDDKQAPTVDHLEDVTVYCDGAPDWADYPKCDDMYPPYPRELRDSKGIVHGYYGGSSQYDVHMGTGDHNDPQACDQNRGWAPIYCKNWLYLDSFDRGGKVNLSDYFEKPVLVDKKRPLDHTLKASEFTFTDNCRLDDASLTVTNNGTINGCGEGWISRTWTIKDKCGNAVSATQKIIVKHRSDFEVIFPADKKVTCDFLNRTDTSELGAGKPKLSDDDCEQLGVTYKDEIFTIVDSACYKIVRTWTIIDWCIYNPNLPTGQAGQQKRYPDVIVNDSLRANASDRACVYRSLKDNNDGYMQYVQIIKVIDELKPHITNCSDQTVCIDKDCTTSVNIPLSGTDNCSDQIRFRADITRPDGTHDKRSDITAITGSNFTVGVYKIQVIAKDQCGNEDTCNMTLTIKDCKKPTPYCLNGIATVVMPSTGSIEVWAKDFDRGASDNCTDASKLKFSFTKNTADASKVLTCANIPNGVEQAINVEVWVTDEAGNQDFCSTYILLQDNGDASNPGGACADTAALVANVTGKLLTEEKEGVEFANVDVQGMQGVPSIVTSTDGSYSFSSIPMNTDHVSIKALRDDNPMNGVSTLDLVLIQKHILGTESLKSPYKMIAADVDNSNDISAIDLLELRKLILGIYDKLPNNTSWKFIPKSYTFSDPVNPWGYPTEDVLTDMNEKMVRDFVGVKIGDVNSSAAAHNLMGTEIRSGETGLIFEVQDQVFKAGDKVSVEFRSPNFKGITGFQGTMSIGNKQLAIDNRQSSIVQSSINFTEHNIGRRWEHEGMVTMSWNTNTSIDLKDDAVLFTMNFTAQSAGRLSEVLRIGSQHTIAESYQGKGELGNLSIRFVGVDGKEVAGKYELYQNYPNPFDQRTVIGLNLAEGVKGNLKITDVTGRIIKSFDREWNKGYNEVWIDRRDMQASGVLFYNFDSKNFKATKRMVIID